LPGRACLSAPYFASSFGSRQVLSLFSTLAEYEVALVHPLLKTNARTLLSPLALAHLPYLALAPLPLLALAQTLPSALAQTHSTTPAHLRLSGP
jgi:hypothetical protein